MKTILMFLITASSLTAGAKFLESHYGKLRTSGHVHSCSFHNSTGGTLDMKYVVFTFAPQSGDSADYDVQERIDQVVEAGDTASASVREVRGRPLWCRFLAR
ncbi:hypothetical protein [Bdellovibrio bacteriovorus]|uniref:Uncharacterized protein n=2 Tax=Bdellovibrio bacteriovorus TaxID=959 RepID=A0A1Z3NAW7_BDEBC|nr:hypothetical protein [Bdellovibrio bacteriovorus]AFY00554.1 hypothetical protein Bdt_0853 [Bdellovibrio bacteriovorus str. Tiberius]ASD64614.1 hypothetical protein B9G79_14040 [Bdellovibrio bacteriovorus]